MEPGEFSPVLVRVRCLKKSKPSTPSRVLLVFWIAGSALLSGGCQSLNLSNEEIAWQTLHAVDVAQTLSAAEDPCYVEAAYFTRQLIGEQP